MKLNKILFSAVLAACTAFGASAQAVEEYEYVFQPHWYGQLQFGAQETLGEGPFGKLLSPNAQIALGYNFNPVLGLRLNVNAWQSKGTMMTMDNRYNWKWNYVAPQLDLMVDLTNLFGGFNPNRVVSAGIFGGLGVNVGFSNKEANNVAKSIMTTYPVITEPLGKLWDGTKCRFVGQFGAYVDFKVSERVKLGLELQANVLPDGYNSKKAGNADWYFNALAGVKIAFGPTYTKRAKEVAPAPEPIIVEKIVEKIVEVPAPHVEDNCPEKDMLRQDVFFKINTFSISEQEMKKVEAIAQFLKNHEHAKVVITGYADKGTGTRAINLRLSSERSKAVAEALEKQYNIAPSRITVKSMGEDEYQPFDTAESCRVAVCVAE